MQWWIAKTSALEGELSTTGPVESTIGGDEILVGRFGGFGRGDRRRDQDAIAERDAGIGRQREIQLLLTLTGEVGAVDADVVQLGDGSGAATAVGVDLRFAGRDFESTDYAKAQEAVFFVRERNFFIESAQGGDALDAAESRPATKDKVGMLLE